MEGQFLELFMNLFFYITEVRGSNSQMCVVEEKKNKIKKKLTHFSKLFSKE